MGAGGCPVVIAQWRSLAAQARCPGFDSRQLLAFSLSSIFTSKYSLYSNMRQEF